MADELEGGYAAVTPAGSHAWAEEEEIWDVSDLGWRCWRYL
jgi:hypothetical protein